MKDNIDIKENIRSFIEGEGKNKGREPSQRYASFDYCFNYFQSFRDSNNQRSLGNIENLQTSCLQLAFYLASWGMLRGSTFLLERSSKFFEPLIKTIANWNPRIWEIDVDDYDDSDARQLLLQCKDVLIHALKTDRSPTDTLITKIMLGVYGNVPAFDANFSRGFKLRQLNDKSLENIFTFYKHNRLAIDSYNIPTIDFLTGQSTKRVYSKAKIIDMIGFIEGQP